MTCTIEINLTPGTPAAVRQDLLARAQQLVSEGYSVSVTELFCDELPDVPLKTVPVMKITGAGLSYYLADFPADAVKPDGWTTGYWIERIKLRTRQTIKPAGAKTLHPGWPACAQPKERPACTDPECCSPCQEQRLRQSATALRYMQQPGKRLPACACRALCTRPSIS